MNLIKILFTLFLPTQILGVVQYTQQEVEQHNTPDDCWVTFEDRVYDLSEYLPDHDKFMDIREWCGEDMTDDFKTKAGVGRDHKEFSYSLLEDYYIGELKADEVQNEVGITNVEESEMQSNPSSPYNLLLPLVLPLAIYWGSYLIFKKENLKKFNGFWNTILLLTFLIPSFGFGIYMMLQYKFVKLREVDFDFMYWHVELSVVMGAIAISHFLQRIKQYLVQLKK
jgi:cytochrome b involved in lipid metabolism